MDLIPDNSHLLLVNPAKPDGRLRTTKALQKRIKQGQPMNNAFNCPRSGTALASASWWCRPAKPSV